MNIDGFGLKSPIRGYELALVEWFPIEILAKAVGFAVIA
jgi:hypothetical protein